VTPQIRTVEDALGVILDWAGRRDVTIPKREPSNAYPDALPLIAAVSDQLGPDFTGDAYYGTLLFAQDRIFRAEELHVADGITCFVEENQGVWAYGFPNGDPGALLVTGDWCDRQGTQYPKDWRPVEATTEDALISVTLLNGVLALGNRCETERTGDFQSVPPETDVLLWRHRAWAGWPGFWRDAENTLLHFGGMGLTLRRAS
jgi:hypothetical protein